jgi:hypothetical protein
VEAMIRSKYLPLGGPIEWNDGLAQAMLISDDKGRMYVG